VKNALKYPPFLILLGIGALLRAGLMIFYYPAVQTSFDSFRFARGGALFDDFWQPAGYPSFLRSLHAVSSHLWVTIAVQHVLGLALAVVVYLFLQRLVPRWVACVPVAALLITGDALFLEHIVLSDLFLVIFSALACCALLMGLIGELNLRWLALAGVLGALALLCRNPGAFLILVLVLVAVFGAAGAWKQRLAAGGVVAGSAVAVTVLYLAIFSIVGGTYSGLTDMSGWFQYARVAHFADCKKFTPPKGTAVLCEKTPESKRRGPVAYTGNPNSPGRLNFRLDPDGAKRIGKFGRAAMLGQPFDYAQAVGTDMVRFIWEPFGFSGDGAGIPANATSFGYRDRGTETIVETSMVPRYKGVHLTATHARAIGDYQQIVRVHGPLVALLFGLIIAAAILVRGPLRLAAVTFGLTAFALYLAAALAFSYNFRYGIPSGFLVAIGGTLASYGLWEKYAPGASGKPAQDP
jgi:hypothetical protein